MMEELHTAMGPPLPSSPSAAVPLARLAHPGTSYSVAEAIESGRRSVSILYSYGDQQCTEFLVPKRHC